MLVYTPISASLLALVYVYLSFRVIGQRHSKKIALGSRADADLERRIRAHGNFMEYTPLALLLLLILELLAPSHILVIAASLLLVIGRGMHAWGISQTREDFRFRKLGMALTFTTLVGLSLGLLWQVLVSAR